MRHSIGNAEKGHYFITCTPPPPFQTPDQSVVCVCAVRWWARGAQERGVPGGGNLLREALREALAMLQVRPTPCSRMFKRLVCGAVSSIS